MSNFANPEIPTNSRNIVLASNTVASPAIVFANDPTVGLYWETNGIHLTGLSTTPTIPSEAASKAYVDSQSGGGGATVALDNLVSVAVNASIIPGVDNSIDLGSSSKSWANGYFGTSVYADTIRAFSTADAVITNNGTLNFIVGGRNQVNIDGTDISCQASTLGISNLGHSSSVTIESQCDSGFENKVFTNATNFVSFGQDTSGNFSVAFNSNLSTPKFKVDQTGGANNTSLWLYDSDSGSISRVKVTANDAVLGVTGRVLYLSDF